MIQSAFTDEQADALASLRDALSASRWALIGASAIKCRVPLPRMTHDIDLAVAASGNTLETALTRSGWGRDTRALQRWRRSSVLVDIVAATDDDIREGVSVLVDGFELTVIGFDLAYSEADDVAIRSDLSVPVARLHALLFLKMVAWLDRPAERGKDLEDIFFLLENALPTDDDFRHDASHPVGAAGLEYDEHNAFYAGWKLGRVAQLAHQHWVSRFLDALRDDDGAPFARFVRSSRVPGDDAHERARARLTVFESGIRIGVQEQAGVATPVAPRAVTAAPGRRPLSVPQGAPTTPAAAENVAALLHDAIDQRRIVRFRALGKVRVGEPHVLGVKDGRLHLLLWQSEGASSSGRLPDWRRFEIRDIRDLETTDAHFHGARADHRGGRHSAFDRHVAVVRLGRERAHGHD